MKGVILIDPGKCLACKTCELQCAVEHSKSKELMKAVCEKPLPQARIKVEAEGDGAIPLQCRHCEDASCVKVCPTKAMVKTEAEGPVLIKEELCTGCKLCIPACPFGVIHIGRGDAAVTKCDFCFERLKKKELPACVQSCPSKAMKFKSIEAINKGKKKDYLVNFKICRDRP